MNPALHETPLGRVAAWFAAGFALLLCGALYAAFRDYDLGLVDEGYLWYGVKRAVAGEVPLRDFQAYDPGRYYWCAAFAPLAGDGLYGLRLATAVFQAVGLTFALLVATRFARNLGELAFCGLLLGLWMFPRHKLFEPALAAMALWFVVRLLERPTLARHVAAGLYGGFAGFFGRNHALYAVAATAFALAWLAWRSRAGFRWQNAGAWALGVLAGYAPMWGMLLFVPGFAAGFLFSNELILQHGSNLPCPYPWPWLTDWTELGGWHLASSIGRAAAFLLPCSLLPVGIVRVLWPRGPASSRPVIVAATLVGLAYVNHVTVRSHWSHLAECLMPVLLLALGLGASATRPGVRPAVWGGLALVSALAFVEGHPLLASLRPGERERLHTLQVEGERLSVPRFLGQSVEEVRNLFDATVPRDEAVFIAPARPALYPILGKVAPTWWICFFWDASEEEQRSLIAELAQEGVKWVLIVDRPLDDVEERRFQNTHPLVWRHLQEEFDQGQAYGRGTRFYVFRRRG